MNLLCPMCQKMLTVPEQFAGQLMKCPLCSGTFTVPALPAGGLPAAAPPPPAVAASAASSTPASPGGPAIPAFASGPQPETYDLAPPPEPAFLTTPTPAPPPPGPKPSASTARSVPSGPTAPATPGDYSTALAITCEPMVLQWIPPVAIGLIFILQIFFSWVGIFPGNLPAITQNAWYAAFGFYSEADDMAKFVEVQPGVSSKTEADAAKKPAETARRDQPEVVLDRPSISLLLIFYLVPFFLVTLVATVLVAVLPYVQLSLPPPVQQLLPWKWVILTALNAVLVLFLGLQMVTYFGIESSYATSIEARFAPAKAANGEGKPERKLTTTEKNQLAVERGKYLQWLQRTTTLYVVLLLHVLSLVSCALIYWIEKRGSARPLPRLEIRY